MREIKFRAWDNTAKKMYYQDENWNGSNGFINLVTIYTGYKDPSEWKNYFIMQYTGLKDINGVEIYERDIVLYKFASYKDISKVVYDEDSASFKMISIKEDDNTSWREFKKGSIHDFYKPFVNGYDFVKVIGNIYENPELLQEV